MYYICTEIWEEPRLLPFFVTFPLKTAILGAHPGKICLPLILICLPQIFLSLPLSKTKHRVGKIWRQKVFPKVKNVNVESLKNCSKLLVFLHTLANPIIIASYGRKYFQLHRNLRCTFFIPLPSSFSSSLPSSFPLFFHLLHFSFHHLIFLSSLDILLYLEVSHADIYRLWKAFRKKGEKIWCFDNSLSSLFSSPWSTSSASTVHAIPRAMC